MMNLNNNDLDLNNDHSIENLDAEAEGLADEIMGALDLKGFGGRKTHGACSITVGPPNSDLHTSAEMDMEKVARLRRMIQKGQYKVDAKAVAAMLMLSGDLNG